VDRSCRLWDLHTGECLQALEGHTDEVFSCAFNYEGDVVITGSKDNTCRIWRAAAATTSHLQQVGRRVQLWVVREGICMRQGFDEWKVRR
jgi:WD40 repeat protein